jgi:aminopeptidase N
MVKTTQPQMIYLKDYKPSHYLIESAFLHFDLQPKQTVVKSLLNFYRNPAVENADTTLTLNGEELQLQSILLNGKPLEQDKYQIEDDKLHLLVVPAQFSLETEVIIKPEENAALSGLYQSRGNYCTQCEAQGFRRITYFLDRPDVLTRFTTTLSADKDRYPVLLSNGNLVDSKELDNNRHWVMWEDPSLKPCYLFALVAGDYDCLTSRFTTMSGREVELRVYVEKGNLPQANYALESLKRAMRWDEETYGREYDLDIYMIVAVSDFNMGAMENKGLNIFNDKYILAKPDTATDDDYSAIESVIGHEYFHNWSGNRVTVRDWFEITLKEGLTIFRDQSFSADMSSKAVKRIKDVNVIRNVQFPQDAGPMAHPIRPDRYIEVNNFYTVTVYNKGAEVIRMQETLLGKEQFRKAMDLYFERYDGKAVTTEDFVKTMEDASGVDLAQFDRWYSQAGTPSLEVTDKYESDLQRYTLHIKQSCPPTPEQLVKKDFHIPVAMGLLDSSGLDMPLQLEGEVDPKGTSRVLSIKNAEETFRFIHVKERPLPSLLRNFSAPVKLSYPYSDEQLIFLMSHDSDGFNSWDAGQQLAARLLLCLIEDYQAQRKLVVDGSFVAAFASVLNNPKIDKMLIAEMLTLPAESYLMELMDVADIEAIYQARKYLRSYLAQQLRETLLHHYHENSSQHNLEMKSKGQRRVKNLCLSYLMLLEDPEILTLAMKQFKPMNNMTDVIGVLSGLTNWDCPEREQTLQQFYDKWQTEALVVDKWFGLQAISSLPNTLAKVKSLTHHPAYDDKNPNKVRALVGAFVTYNYLGFHNKNGEGYQFLVDQVLHFDTFNPQLAARMIEPLIRWRKYDSQRQELMHQQLERIAKESRLSSDVYEIVHKSLSD